MFVNRSWLGPTSRDALFDTAATGPSVRTANWRVTAFPVVLNAVRGMMIESPGLRNLGSAGVITTGSETFMGIWAEPNRSPL
jgi:ABC-type uncharacterized transport system permease subunit